VDGKTVTPAESPAVLEGLHRLFRDFFDRAEEKRRWSIRDSVPWEECNRSLNPALADIVETFCAVELYLPDYLAKLIMQVRANRGRAWFLANWGYEEAKHSLALEDWLLKSGQRSDERIADMHREVFSHEWQLPHDSARGMLCYAMFQELATQMHYVNLRSCVRAEGGCPALEKVLTLVAADEAAHADFFFKCVAIYLEHDREETLEQLRRVGNAFRMPAVHMLADGAVRQNEVRRFKIFDEEVWYHHVLEPALTRLGLTRHDLRRKTRREVCGPGD
jgi:acyl-[acyl-carrier-protein] desaturase